MAKANLVSVIMCVYNGEKYLSQQISSILNQTYTTLELLILDDCSSDKSLDIINHYLQLDSRIKLIKNPVNLGFNKNFENGLQLANGDLIAISDQDDIWLPHKISRLVENLDDVLLVYSNSELIDESGNILKKTLDRNIEHLNRPQFTSFLDENFVTGHTCLLKKELLKYILPFPKDIFFYDWWIGFAASYVGKINYLNEVLTYYRIHPSSWMQLQAVNTKDKISERLIKKKKQIEGFCSAGFLNKEDKNFIKKWLKLMDTSTGGVKNRFVCFFFLLKYHRQIYPWYRKSDFKKLNFIRKRCFN